MHYVYKLTVGGQPYFGYTSREPQERLKEHLDTAYAQKWKHNSKLYPMLVEMEYEHEFEVLQSFDTELAALLFEIHSIASVGKDLTLNLSDGGEGSTMTVYVRMNEDGKQEFKVVPKKGGNKRKPTRPTRRRRRYRRR